MNSYSFGISGSAWLLILLSLAAIAFSYWSYRRTNPQVSASRRLALMVLRALALVLLIFALFEPIYSLIAASEQAPKVSVIMDNSESMKSADAGGQRLPKYKRAYSSIDFEDIGEDNLSFFKFDASITKISNFTFDSLDFKGKSTNLSLALKRIAEEAEDENLQAALIFTDGSFNAGSNPIYYAEELGKPLYIVGIGDSADPKDILIESVVANEIAYIDIPAPISINIEAHGFAEDNLNVILYDNEKQINEQTINIHPDKKQYPVVIEYKPKTEGMHKLTARVSNKQGEITVKNNAGRHYIKVLNNKKRIALFAGAPSPDYSFIKNALMQDEEIELKEYIQKKGGEFYNNPNPQDINKTEIIFLIGFPISSTPKEVINSISNEASKGKSIFFIASKDVDYNLLKKLEEYLPFNVSSFNQREFQVSADVNESAVNNPLIRVQGAENDFERWNSLPPVYRTELFVNKKPESESISNIKVNNVKLNEPLILSRSFGDKKSVAVLGYGLYRWKLMGYAPEAGNKNGSALDLFSTLLNNSVKWLSVNEEMKQVRIKTDKNIYNPAERIQVFAQVYDASYNPIDNANVSIKIKSSNDDRDLILNSIGNGRYSGSIENLREGDYTFAGRAVSNNKEIGSDNGRFMVGDIALEFQNLKLNSSLLRAMADRTGGKFYLFNQVQNLANDIKKSPNFIPRHVTEKSEINLWNKPWLITLAIALLSFEWFIRKRSGMI